MSFCALIFIYVVAGTLCGIVVNEIEGFLEENITETDLQEIIRKGIQNDELLLAVKTQFQTMCTSAAQQIKGVETHIV